MASQLGTNKDDNETTVDAMARWGLSAGRGSGKCALYAHPFEGGIALKYKMDHCKRGIALILNHEGFHPSIYRKRRVGTQIDADKLELRFQRLGFDVQVHKDLSVIQVKEVFSEASNADHSEYDAFVCVILSHGEKDGYIYGYDGVVSLQELLEQFRADVCPTLAGKPKLFFIEASRGARYEYAIDSVDGQDEGRVDEPMDEVDGGTRPTIPAGSDFFVAYSTIEGSHSHRNALSGSWFIQELSYVLENYGEEIEICDMMILVNRRVAQRQIEPTDSDDQGIVGGKQIPCYLSMLTKRLYFTKKKEL
ncbi:caspase-6-like [Glandiceps talaboti]